MHSFSDQLLSYAAYHRNPWNKLTHFFGVPIVIYSIFIPMGWFRFAPADVPLTGATLFVLATFIYYWRLDKVIALLVTPLTLTLLWLADRASRLPFWESVAYFAVSFALGWVAQLIGHVFERRRPALADNILQIFNAPLFLVVEIMFALGMRKELRARVQEGAPRRGSDSRS